MAHLLQLQPDLGYAIKSLDIDDEQQVSKHERERYTADVPVVMYQGEVIFYHFFDEIALRDALQHS